MFPETDDLANWLDRILSRMGRAVSRRRGTTSEGVFERKTGPDASGHPDPPVSKKVMPEVLSIEQFDERLDDGIVIKSEEFPGRAYVVKRDEKIQVWQNKRLLGYLCVAPKATRVSPSLYLPTTETYLSYYLNLTLNEGEFLKVANLQRTAAIYFREERFADLR